MRNSNASSYTEMGQLIEIEKRQRANKILLFTFHVFLLVGAFVMVFPFLLMVGISLQGEANRGENGLIPRFFYDMDALAKEYALFKYTGKGRGPVIRAKVDLNADWEAQEFYEIDDFMSSNYSAFFDSIPEEKQALQIEDYEAFLSELDWPFFNGYEFSVHPEYVNKWSFYNAHYEDYGGADVVPHQRSRLSWRAFREFRESIPPALRRVSSPRWGTWLQKHYDTDDISIISEAHDEDYVSVDTVHLPNEVPNHPQMRADYREYVRTHISYQNLIVHVSGDYQDKWIDFLKNDLAIYDAERWLAYTGEKVERIEDIQFPSVKPEYDRVITDFWAIFVTKEVADEDIRIETKTNQLINFMQARLGTIEAANNRWGTQFQSWDELYPEWFDGLRTYREILEHPWLIRWEVATRHFQKHFRTIMKGPSSFSNSLILMLMAGVVAIVVNPIAAYILSRSRVRTKNKYLLFILGTMALPMELAMVPQFLLITDLGLINNFWAVVLPTAANAFSIILLKGYYDSLPPELFEVAEMEGAREWVIFWKIGIPMSRALIAVTTLGAVVAAYSSFIPSLLYLQDPSVWPLVLELIKNSESGKNSEVMSWVVISALPTLVLYLLCHKIVERGILVPTYE